MTLRLQEIVREAERRRAEDEIALRREVLACRENGTTWEAIGRALGVTKQAAQQRYGVGS